MKNTPASTAILIGAHGLGTETTSDIETVAAMIKAELGIVIRVIPIEDPYRKREWFKHGYTDLSYSPSNFPMRNQGIDPLDIGKWGGPFQVRVVASAHTGSDGFMVRGDSPIHRLADIGPDTRLGIYRDPSMVHALLAWGGLYTGDLKDGKSTTWKTRFIFNDHWETYLKSLHKGDTDLVFASAESPFVKEMAAAPPGIRFLPLPMDEDTAGYQRFRRFMPFGSIKPAPEGIGAREIWGVNTFIGTGCMWSKPDTNEELSYVLTRWFDQAYPRYCERGHKLKAYSREAMRLTLDVALAPIDGGATRWFRECGMWTEADDRRHRYNLHLMEWYGRLWEEASLKAASQNIVQDGLNPAWRNAWEDSKRKAGIPAIRQMTDPEIKAGLAELESGKQ